MAKFYYLLCCQISSPQNSVELCDPPPRRAVRQRTGAVGGQWGQAAQTKSIQDPWTGEEFITLPDPQVSEISPYVESLKKVTKSGLHNPFKNPERYTNTSPIHLPPHLVVTFLTAEPC